MNDLWREWAELLERVGGSPHPGSEWLSAVRAVTSIFPPREYPEVVGPMLHRPDPNIPVDWVPPDEEQRVFDEVLVHAARAGAAIRDGSAFARQHVDSLRAAVVRRELERERYVAENLRMAGG
ncbi:MAG: hypothetical protein Q8S73_34500 [Deltaproteobacteria bacterium]|nr:hypothetical protein [Myxococcales bacterium]MDP3219261.1 hypothetical protein [Deltaproteobacteria bacterium]